MPYILIFRVFKTFLIGKGKPQQHLSSKLRNFCADLARIRIRTFPGFATLVMSMEVTSVANPDPFYFAWIRIRPDFGNDCIFQYLFFNRK